MEISDHVLYATPGSKHYKLKHLCVMWEAWKRRKGGMWPAPNKGTAGLNRANRLLSFLETRHVRDD